MTEDELLALVTSIDENDIEIIPSNGFETNEEPEIISDHLAVENIRVNPPVVSAPVIPFNREDSEEFEDETFTERLYGLTEMFPRWLQSFFQNSYQYSKYAGQWMRRSVWFCSSSFLVLILPILVQLEFSQVAEMQAAQTRQLLLGPTAQIGSTVGYQ